MSVAEHLGIRTEEYDQQILTLIPFYDEVLQAAAGALTALDRPARHVVDLGTGSGALAARSVKALGRVKVTGIDADPAMLAMAAKRLGKALTPVVGTLEATPFPACDVVTASFSLHHIGSPAVKLRIFKRAFAALRPGGLLVDADCMLNDDPRLQARDYETWRSHLATTHGAAGARKFLKAWAGEDIYFPLGLEVLLLRKAGFTVDVVWRKASLAVVAASKPRSATGRRS